MSSIVAFRATLPVPSKLTAAAVMSPAMLKFLPFARAVAVAALPPASPDTLPVTSPVRSPVKVVAVTDVRLISESRATLTPLDAAVVVTFEPPVTENVSFKKSISSEPESPVTVIPEPTAAVEVAVIRPFASTVRTGIAVPEPIVPAATPVSTRSTVGVEPSPVPPVTLMLEAVPERDST